MFVLRVGERDVPRNLGRILREAFEERRQARLREIEERKRLDVPADEGEPWHVSAATRVLKVQAAIEGERRDEARQEAAGLLEVIKEPPADLGEWDGPAFLDGIDVVFRAISEDDYTHAVVSLAEIADESRKMQDADLRTTLAHGKRAKAVRAEFVSKAIAEVHGLRGPSGPFSITADGSAPISADDIATLSASGLLEWLYLAAERYQGLGSEGKERCGLPAPSTSESSGVGSAHSTYGAHEDATSLDTSSGFRAPSTRTEPVPVVTTSTTHGSAPLTSSTSIPMGGSSASTG